VSIDVPVTGASPDQVLPFAHTLPGGLMATRRNALAVAKVAKKRQPWRIQADVPAFSGINIDPPLRRMVFSCNHRGNLH